MKIAIILPYYGKFPNYFRLWIESARCNSNFDFLIFTDNENIYGKVENIKWIKFEFSMIKSKIESIVGFPVILDRPYKLCDYRPVYGLIFEEYLKNYTWWGYCDPDIIFGNLDKKITYELLHTYDKIYELGHLTLYRNEEKINNLWKIELPTGAYSYKNVFTSRYSAHFDEQLGMIPICNSYGCKTYNAVDFADIKVGKGMFQRCWDRESGDYPHIFGWSNGTLLGYMINDKDKLVVKEYIYIHLQKRKMTLCFKPKEKIEKFMIIPNSFIEYDTDLINEKFILDSNNKIPDDKMSLKDKIKTRLYNISNGALKHKYIRKKKNIKFPETY